MPQDNTADHKADKPHDDERRVITAPPGLRGFGRLSFLLILLSVAILCVSAGLLIYGLREPSEGTKFWAPYVLNFLLLAFVAVQVIINARQWEVMERSIEESRESREIENRAFVAIADVEIEGGFLTASESGNFLITTKFLNVGKTPAKGVRGRWRVAFLPVIHDSRIPAIDRQQQIERQSHAVLLPNVERHPTIEVSFSAEDIDECMTEGERLHVCGDILYEDVFGKRRETKFCWFVAYPDRTHLAMCTIPNHNTIE